MELIRVKCRDAFEFVTIKRDELNVNTFRQKGSSMSDKFSSQL